MCRELEIHGEIRGWPDARDKVDQSKQHVGTWAQWKSNITKPTSDYYYNSPVVITFSLNDITLTSSSS